jgi:hypothetical protein
MRRFLLCTALALCVSVYVVHPQQIVTAFGCSTMPETRWSLCHLNNRCHATARSQRQIICDQEDKSALVGAILIPVDGTFENRQRIIPVLIQKNEDLYDPSDVLQHWKNGTEYIFVESNDQTDKLASFLKANEADGLKSVHFFFPNESDAGPQTANHIVVDLAGFSDGFSAFKKACAM